MSSLAEIESELEKARVEKEKAEKAFYDLFNARTVAILDLHGLKPGDKLALTDALREHCEEYLNRSYEDDWVYYWGKLGYAEIKGYAHRTNGRDYGGVYIGNVNVGSVEIEMIVGLRAAYLAEVADQVN